MNKIHYIGERPSPGNMHAGSKARIDVDIILEKKGYHRQINLSNSKKCGFISRILYEIKKLEALISISKIKNKYLILQYPYYISKILRTKLYSRLSQNRVILMIHDIDSIRDGKNIKKEVDFLNKAYILIVHNEIMLNKLLELGVRTRMINLQLFDYLIYDALPNQKYTLGNKIVFAGNLGKSKFLQSKDCENLNLEFCLYGPNFDKKTMCHRNMTYCGSFLPNIIPYNLNGSFGLIWDGDTVSECTGLMGEYTRYNNPHKLSMYIAAGLPVIVWKESAIARFVIDNNIGLTVNNLTEIEGYIKKLDNNDYNDFLRNIKKLQKEVCSGYFTNKALTKVEEIIQEST